MTRRRLISSSMDRDEWFGHLSFFERDLWRALVTTCADDQGRLLDNAALIRSDAFPYMEIAPEEIDRALNGFQAADWRILRYRQDGRGYIQIVNWWEHQTLQWAAPSRWPAPAGWQDHVRTRENRAYVERNWAGPAEHARQGRAYRELLRATDGRPWEAEQAEAPGQLAAELRPAPSATELKGSDGGHPKSSGEAHLNSSGEGELKGSDESELKGSDGGDLNASVSCLPSPVSRLPSPVSHTPGAGAPACASGPDPPAELELSDLEAQEVVDALSRYFCERTGLAPPVVTSADRRRRWEEPLRSLAVLVGWDVDAGEDLMRRAVETLEGKDCLVVAPSSIMRTVVRLAGKAKVQSDRRRYVRGRYGDRVQR